MAYEDPPRPRSSAAPCRRGGGDAEGLVREPDAVQQRTLKITFLEPGAEAYAFTFG